METLLLDDATYVQERYHELELARKQQRQLAHVAGSPCVEPTRGSAAINNDDDINFDRDRVDRVTAMDAAWPITPLEKKMLVMEAVLDDLAKLGRVVMTTVAARSNPSSLKREAQPSKSKVTQPNDSSGPLAVTQLPASMQLGLKLFFRLCASLRDPARLQSSGRVLTHVASKLPSILASLPPFPLSPGVIDAPLDMDGIEVSSTPPEVLSVFEDLFDLLGRLLGIRPANGQGSPMDTDKEEIVKWTDEERATLLTAFVALSIKWGRQRDLLSSIYELRLHPSLLSTINAQQLQPLLLELATATVALSSPSLPEEVCPSGILFTFGKGDHGKLGHGQCSHASCSEGNCTENKNVPTIVASTRELPFVKIDSLSTHSIAITGQGELLAWGNGDKYRLGHGTTTKEYSPRIIDSLSLKGKVVDVACGLGHTIALMFSGDVYAWGNGSNGRLGVGDANDRASPTKLVFSGDEYSPNSGVPSNSSSGRIAFRHVYCGASHSLAVSSDGRAFAWGKNNQGQCGLGHTNDQLTVAEVRFFLHESDERVVHAAGGWEHTLFCSATGRVYSCGSGYKDSRRTGIPPVLGHGDSERRLKPSPIQAFMDSNDEIVKVACGWDHSLAISSQGSLFTWGSGTNGKLGHGDEENCEIPAVVRGLNGKIVKDVKAGCEHTVVLTDQCEVWTFGQGDSGRLGHGDNQTKKVPTMVEFFGQSGLRPVAIAVGDKYNLVLVEDSGGHHHAKDTAAIGQQIPVVNSRSASHSAQSRRLHTLREELRRKRFEGRRLLNDRETVHELLRSEAATMIDSGSSQEPPEQNQKIKLPSDPDTATELVQFLVYHTVRIASGYMRNQPDKALSVHDRDVSLRPFGVDTSDVALRRASRIIRLELISAKDKDDEAHVKPRMRVVLACLRIVAVNLYHRVQTNNTFSSNLPAFQNEEETTSLVRDTREIIEMFSSSDTNKTVQLFTQHAKEPDVQVLAEAINAAAAEALKLGFEHLFPSDDDRRCLLWDFVQSIVVVHSQSRASALTARLCEDRVMGKIILSFFNASVDAPMTHTCAMDAVTVFEPSKSQFMERDPSQLVALTKKLLLTCASVANQHLGVDDPSIDSFCDENTPLEILSVMQGHLFGAVTACKPVAIRSTSECAISRDTEGFRVCACALNVLVDYMDLLFVESATIIKRLHKATCQNETNITGRLKKTLVAQLLISACDGVYALLPKSERHESNISSDLNAIGIRFAEVLLPATQAMLKCLDEIIWKIQGLDASNNQDEKAFVTTDHTWVNELGAACAMLSGRLASQLIDQAILGRKRSSELHIFCHKLGGDELDVDMSICKSIADNTVFEWENRGLIDSVDELNVDRESLALQYNNHVEDRTFLAKCLQQPDLFETTFRHASSGGMSDESWRLLYSSGLLRAGLAIILWNSRCISELRHGGVQGESAQPHTVREQSVTWNLCIETYEAFQRQIVAYAGAVVDVENLTTKVKILLCYEPRSLPTGSSLDEWIAILTIYLLKFSVTDDLFTHWAVASEMFRIGLAVYTDLLRKVTASNLRRCIVGELSHELRRNIGCVTEPTLSIIRRTRKLSTTTRELFYELAKVAIDNSASYQAREKALALWAWVVGSHLLDTRGVSRLIAETGIVPAVCTMLLQVEPRSNTLKPSASLVNFNTTPSRSLQHCLPLKLRPIETLVLGYSPRQLLEAVACEVLCASASHLGVLRLDPNTPGPNHPVTNMDILSARSPTISPRKRLPVPCKSVTMSVEECRQATLDCVFALLRRTVHDFQRQNEAISPFLRRDHAPERSSTRYSQVFLAGTPVSISPVKCHVIKPLKLPQHSVISASMDPSPGAHTLSFWFHVDISSHTHIASHSSAIPFTLLLALGQPLGKGKDTTARSPDAFDELEKASLVVFMCGDTADRPKLGICIPNTRPKESTVPTWSVQYVEGFDLQGWLHLVIVVSADKGPVVYLQGEPVLCTIASNGQFDDDVYFVGSQLTCGGSLDETWRSNLSIVQQYDSLCSSGVACALMEMVVDDVWLISPALAHEDVAKLNNQGPTLAQVKFQYHLQTRCSDLLMLLCRISHISGSRDLLGEIGPGVWNDLLLDLLDFTQSNTQAFSCVYELLFHLLPQIETPSPAILHKLVAIAFAGCGVPSPASRAEIHQSWDLVSGYNAFCSLIPRLVDHSPALIASQGALLAWLRDRGVLNSQNHLVDGSRRGHSRPCPASLGVDYSSTRSAITIKLLQLIVRSPSWKAIVTNWTEDARIHIEDALTKAKLLSNQRNEQPELNLLTQAAIATGGGYSELQVNEGKVEICQDHMALRAISTLQLEHPLQSVPIGQVTPAFVEWTKVLVDFALDRELLRSLPWTGTLSADFDEVSNLDGKMALLFKLQLLGLRYAMVQLENGQENGWRNRMLAKAELVEGVLYSASIRARDFVQARLGSDAKKALNLESTRAVMQELLNKRSNSGDVVRPVRLGELEALTWDVWDCRRRQSDYLQSSQRTWRSAPPKVSPLEILGGEAEIRDLTVRALEHFPTVRLSKVSIAANTGLWYYEALILSDALVQIGYVDDDFAADAINGQGVGDHVNSWAFDGFRQKKWNVNPSDYGEAWRTGDVVGVLLDTDRMELSYFLNGKFLGVAFTGLPMTSTSTMHPAASLSADQVLQFNFGSRVKSIDSAQSSMSDRLAGFLHVPQLDSGLDQERLQSVAYASDDDKLGEPSEDAPPNIVRSDDTESDSHDSYESNEEESCPRRNTGQSLRFDLPGSLLEMDSGSSFRSVQNDLGIHPDPRYLAHNRQEDQHANESGDDEEPTVRQRELVEGLVALGFPHNWATRCALETTFTVSDSGAVSWILEQMEREVSASMARVEGSLTQDSDCDNSIPSMTTVEPIRAHTVRALDDLSLPSSIIPGSPRGAFVRSTWQLQLSPTRANRPHTEHQIRTRGWLQLEQPKQDARGVNSTIVSNPFIRTDEQETETSSDESFSIMRACQQMYVRRAGTSLRSRIFSRLSEPESDLKRKAQKNCVSVGWHLTEDDLLPASVVLHATLTALYCRHIVHSLLFQRVSPADVDQGYALMLTWAKQCTGNVFSFLRKQLMLDPREECMAVEQLADFDSARQLREALLRYLAFERNISGNASPSDAESAPLFRCFNDELQRHTSRALILVAETKRRPKSTYAVKSIAMNARWAVWVSEILSSSLVVPLADDSLSYPGSKSLECTLALSDLLFDETRVKDLVVIASCAIDVLAPWRTAAFAMMKLAMIEKIQGVPDVVAHEQNKYGSFLPTRCFVEFFAAQYKKEKSRHLAFSDTTTSIWDIILDKFALPQHDRLGDETTHATGGRIKVRVESISSTHAAISWEYTSNADKPPADVPNMIEDNDNSTPTVTLADEIDSGAMTLEVVSDQSEGDRADIGFVPHSLPPRGSHTLRNLAPDTGYTIRITHARSMLSKPVVENGDNLPIEPISRLTKSIRFVTPSEPVFELSGDASGSNLLVFNGHRCVKNLVNKKWNTVRATVAFDEGVHHWHVRIDNCVSKNIFIGICTTQASLDNYIGSDAFGYGFLANKAMWHNKSKIHSYGEIFKQGDLIQVTLDCSAKTLSYSRNGEFLGVAATNLHVGGTAPDSTSSTGCQWYPAFSLYNKDDQLTLIPPTANHLDARSTASEYASVSDLVASARIVSAYLVSAKPSALLPNQSSETWNAITSATYGLWQRWREGDLCWRETGLGSVIALDGSAGATAEYCVARGDSMFTNRGQCIALGVYNHEMWYETSDALEGSDDRREMGSWSLHACREMAKSPDEFPVHRERQRENLSQAPQLTDRLRSVETEIGVEVDVDAAHRTVTPPHDLVQFAQIQQAWTTIGVDSHLVALLDALAASRGVDTPHRATFTDLCSAFLIHDLPDSIAEMLSAPKLAEIKFPGGFSRDVVLARLCFLYEVNRHIYQVIRLFLRRSMMSQSPWTLAVSTSSDGEQSSEEAQGGCSYENLVQVASQLANLDGDSPERRDSTQQVIILATQTLFACQVERLMDEALRRTMTVTLSPSPADAADKTNDLTLSDGAEPKDLPRLSVRYPPEPATPFWKVREAELAPKVLWMVGDQIQRESSLFMQISQQLAKLDPRECRREFASGLESVPITRSFHIEIEGEQTASGTTISDSSAGVDSSSASSSDQTSRYLKLWDDIMVEVQSSHFPLFVPVTIRRPDQYVSATEGDGALAEAVQLDVNSSLLLPEVIVRAHLLEDEVLLWYFQFGQILGITWRSKNILPLQNLSNDFWSDVIFHFKPYSRDTTDRQARARVKAIRAIRDGLCTIVPSECLQLSTPTSLRARLSDSDAFRVNKLQDSATYDRQMPHHQAFWSVLHSFASLERRAFFQFIAGKSLRGSICAVRHGWSVDGDPIQQWKQQVAMSGVWDRARILINPSFTLEIADALADAHDHPDACYPVVLVLDETRSRLHLPAYSSTHVLRKKLALAMNNLPAL